ncbi:hypothetical protein C8R44DRAFT_112400 [Mycena epipterygia]|nr:hypothetical protein C8R44DRAFT_112400 [Mycena epipterygia]
MKFPTSLVAAAIAIPVVHALTINTPTASTVVVCEPLQLAWSGGTSPYFLIIIPGGDTSGSVLKTFDTTNSTAITWTVDIAVGIAITFAIKDSAGTLAYSDQDTVLNGTDTSCIDSSVSASGSVVTTATGATDTAGATTTAPGTTTQTASTTAKASATTSSTTASSASPSTSSNSASRSEVSIYGFIGILVLAMV